MRTAWFTESAFVTISYSKYHDDYKNGTPKVYKTQSNTYLIVKKSI